MGQRVMSCLQTVDAGNERSSPMLDPLSIVIEEVHMMGEAEWHHEKVPFHNQQDLIVFNHLCRVCALETENLVSVFGEEGTKLKLAEKIHWHLPIEVSCISE
jgi:hypothetical protein